MGTGFLSGDLRPCQVNINVLNFIKGHEGTRITPLPSGIYSYAYLVDCNYAPNCSIATGQLVTDPDLPPFQNVEGDQVASSFQVPFNAQFQGTDDISANFDYALPAPAEFRGTIKSVNYTSPG